MNGSTKGTQPDSPVRRSPSNRPRLAVVGGGASGLTLAWMLQDDYEVSVFERGPEVGGNWSTINIDGTNIEMGAVKVFDHNRHLRRLCELMGMSLTVDQVFPDGAVKWDDTFRLHYPHVKSKAARGALMGASFGYLLTYLGLYHALEPARRRMPSSMGGLKLRHVDKLTGLAFAPRSLRETVRAFLWMGALTYEEIDESGFMGLMANVDNNFAGFGRFRIFNIDQGFQGLARALARSNPNSRIECGAEVLEVRDDPEFEGRPEMQLRWRREDGGEELETFEHVVFACPPWRAAQILRVRAAEPVRRRLEKFVNAPNRVSLHDDEAIVKRSGMVQLTVDAKAYYASLRTGVRNLWKSYQSFPTPERFAHPRRDSIEDEKVFDTDAFRAVDEVRAMNSDAVQGVANTWYIHNAYHPSLVRNGEQAVEQAMGLCRRLAPDSPRLAALEVAPQPVG